MAELSPSTLEDHPAGTLNVGGIINDNWQKLNKIFDPALSGADPLYGLIAAALRGQGGGMETLTYSATVDIDFSLKEVQLLALTGDVTFTFSNLAAGKNVRLLIAADATPRNIAWPASVNWAGAEPLSIGASEYLMVELISTGTTATNVYGTTGSGSGGGGGGASGAAYLFNTATSGDPTTGQILLNNATVASATALNISETDNDGNGIAAFIAAWDNSTGTVKGTLKILDEADPTNFAYFDITGTLTDSGTYDTFNATHIASGGTFTNGLAVRVEFTRAGDAGSTGATGAAGTSGLSYAFDTATSGDPGSGELLFDNATVASVTAVHLSETDGLAGNVSAFLSTWDDSTSTIKGFLLVRSKTTPASFALFSISAHADPGAYRVMTVAHIASNGTFSAAEALSVEFTRNGDAGSTGAAGADGDSSIHVEYEGPTAGTYTLMLYATRAGTIDRLVAKTTSGTCTAAVKINGVDVTGLAAVAVSSTLSNTVATAANTYIVGDLIELVLSSVSSATFLKISLQIS